MGRVGMQAMAVFNDYSSEYSTKDLAHAERSDSCDGSF